MFAFEPMRKLTDMRFGRLVARRATERRSGNNIVWECICDCGTVAHVASYSLLSGATQSCGCLHREITSKAAIARTLHGHAANDTLTPEYAAWCNAKHRCFNQANHAFGNYGGRGVTMCDRWRDSFENFYADMGPRPSPMHSIDRFPNNNGNYEPGNCRWATKKEQAVNRRGNRLLTYNGLTLTLSEWARRININHQTLQMRLAAGWTEADAITKPLRPY